MSSDLPESTASKLIGPTVWTRVNGMDLRFREDFLAMFPHCRRADGSYQIETKHYLLTEERLPIGGVAVDIGASGGVFTAGFSRKVGPNGVVFAFEPARTANEILRATVSANGLTNVVIENSAVAAMDGVGQFFELPRTSGCTWRPEASALNVREDQKGNSVSYRVKTVSLDSYFVSAIRIDAIKIDVEGFESNVLMGGRQVISRLKPFIAIDIHNRLSGPGETEDDCRAMIEPFGYKCERLDHVLFCFT